MKPLCSVSDCERVRVTRNGFCKKHYQNNSRHGTPVVKSPRERHGMFGTPEHKAWAHMIARCVAGHPAAKWYADRGITVCQEWRKSFSAFYRHIGKRPSSAHSLDRIDTNGNYEPGNVRWATAIEQTRNRRVDTRSKTGVMGVRWHKARQKWYAHISVDKKFISLGYYHDIENAILIRLSAEAQLWI